MKNYRVIFTPITFLVLLNNVLFSQPRENPPFDICKNYQDYYLNTYVDEGIIANDIKKNQPIIQKNKIKSITIKTERNLIGSVNDYNTETYGFDKNGLLSFRKDSSIILREDEKAREQSKEVVYNYVNNKLSSYCADSTEHYDFKYDSKGRVCQITNKHLKDYVLPLWVDGHLRDVIIKADTNYLISILYDYRNRITQYKQLNMDTLQGKSFNYDYVYKDSVMEVYKDNVLGEKIIFDKKGRVAERTNLDTIENKAYQHEVIKYIDDFILSSTRFLNSSKMDGFKTHHFQDGLISSISFIYNDDESHQWFYEYNSNGLVQKIYMYRVALSDVVFKTATYTYSYW